ncbi:MAG TPA: 6-carboxytetrahydropterin synthase [Tepidisphaeraceae bacterium]|nr:6-carboxytetrahydropterin synthase [Tepidisphaeraceae bacterium]
MFQLTRAIRFAIPPAGDPPGSKPRHANGHAGWPAIESVGSRWIEMRVTLAGELDPASSYLRNIKQIDERARALALPIIQQCVQQHAPGFDLPLRLHHHLQGTWAGARVVAVALALSPYTEISVREEELPMVRLAHRFEFSAAHRLHNPNLTDAENRAMFGKCNNPHGHGHNYELQVTVAGPIRADGRIIEIDQLERIVDDAVIQPFDHKHLNIEVCDFAELNPSVEHIAQTIFRRLKPRCADRQIRLASVIVWETPKTFAEYSE